MLHFLSEVQRCVEVIYGLLIFAHIDGHSPEISTHIRHPDPVSQTLSDLQTLQQVIATFVIAAHDRRRVAHGTKLGADLLRISKLAGDN